MDRGGLVIQIVGTCTDRGRYLTPNHVHCVPGAYKDTQNASLYIQRLTPHHTTFHMHLTPVL